MVPSAPRVRLAPSPTGQLHVGTARSALYNELFARQHGGTFVIRIEDTDEERSQAAFEANILEGLAWLGLQWDEGPDVGGPFGPYRQSERRELHRLSVQQLLESGHAYTDPTGESEAVWLSVPADPVTFTDLIRGDVTVQPAAWGGDFVIARSPEAPLFHLAVVADDAAMEITHVIRGEDHLTNTARHILLQRALGVATPQYAHLPLLLDEQRRKLSKRAGEVSLLAYRDQGYVASAMVNYLALLGWNPKDNQEFFTHEELIARFSLSGVQKGGAIFSLPKLQAINKHYLRALPPTTFFQQAAPFLRAAGYPLTAETEPYWQQAVATEQERVATLAELPQVLAFFRPDWTGEYPSERLVWRKGTAAEACDRLGKAHSFLSNIPADSYTEPELTTQVLEWIDTTTLGRGDTLWPVRVALTGEEHSPSPFAVASVLGKETTLLRIQAAQQKLARDGAC